MPHRDQNFRHAFPVTALPQNRPQPFDIVPDEGARAALAQELGLSALRKLRFTGDIRSSGKRDWVLSGQLGATVVQPCVQTLEPVTTRIDVPVERRYLAGWTPTEEPGAETEMPEDVSTEPVPATIDAWTVMAEDLAIAVPDYPRAEDAPPLGEMVVTEPGRAPLRDEDTKTFAGLAALKDKLGGNGSD